MPALHELTNEEKDWLCDTISQVVSEENTDFLLESLESRLEDLVEKVMPWGLGFLKGYVLGRARQVADDALPGLLRDPILKILRCPNAGD